MGKSNRLYLRLTDEQLAEIQTQADLHTTSKANYCRQRALSTLRSGADRLAIRQLVGLGNNMNQIAKNLHIGNQVDDELREELKVTMAKVQDAVFSLKQGEVVNDNE